MLLVRHSHIEAVVALHLGGMLKLKDARLLSEADDQVAPQTPVDQPDDDVPCDRQHDASNRRKIPKRGLPVFHGEEVRVNAVFVTGAVSGGVDLEGHDSELCLELGATTQGNGGVYLVGGGAVRTGDLLPEVLEVARTIIDELEMDWVPAHAHEPLIAVASRWTVGLLVFDVVKRTLRQGDGNRL